MSNKKPVVHVIRKGLDLPIDAVAAQSVEPGPRVERVALLADDYVGMRPRMLVEEGQQVSRGQKLFEDRKNPGVFYTAPGGGIVEKVNRGERRALQSVVIALAGDEKDIPFEAYIPKAVEQWSGAEVRQLMLESGMWTALRTRPFSRSPEPSSKPHSIFVTATDSHSLSGDPAVVLAGHGEPFVAGLKALVKLGEGCPVYLCRNVGASIPGDDVAGVDVHEFSGPHPSGTVGVHIHLVDPVNASKMVWHIDYQETSALGTLLTTGKLGVERVISVAGPQVEKPALLRTRLGAQVAPLLAGRLRDGENRVISGSALYGRAAGEGPTGYVGRFNNQVTVLAEDRGRHFLGWMGPGMDKFSVLPLFFSLLKGAGQKFKLGTSTHGSQRSIVPFGAFEKVMPMDILPTFLMRALLSHDILQSQQLGAMELDEEDVSLCTFVCPGKNDYGPALRAVLTTIEKEG